jgi:hypothetical protein
MMSFGKSLVVLGAVIIVTGIVLIFIPEIPYSGKLPGNIHIRKENFDLYIPIVTGLLLSLFLSGIFWLISYLGKK